MSLYSLYLANWLYIVYESKVILKLETYLHSVFSKPALSQMMPTVHPHEAVELLKCDWSELRHAVNVKYICISA